MALATLSLTFSACKSSKRDEPIPPPPPQPEKPKEYLKPNPIKTIIIQDEDESLVTTASYSEEGDLIKSIVELVQPDGERQLAQEYLYERAFYGNRIIRYTNHGLRGTKAEVTVFRYRYSSGMSSLPTPLRRYYQSELWTTLPTRENMCDSNILSMMVEVAEHKSLSGVHPLSGEVNAQSWRQQLMWTDRGER